MYDSTNPKQPFYVANKIVMTQNEQKVLTKLYQPLVGILGVGLYTTLINEFDTIPFAGEYKTLYQLQEQTDSNLKDIFSSLHHLEAVGLLKTYLGQNPVLGDVIIFELLSVPSPQDFFSTFLLSSLLRERVGEVSFERLVKEFTPRYFVGLKEATEVTAGFFDVFHLSDKSAIDPAPQIKKAHQQVGENKKQELQLGNVKNKVDWEFLIALFDAYHIDNTEVNKHRTEILQLMNFYDLSEQDFVGEAILTLSAGRTTLNMQAIAAVIAENYGQKKTKDSVKKQTQLPKDAVTTIKNLSSKDDELLKDVNQYTAIEYLYHLKEEKGGYVTPNEKRVVYRMQNQYGLSTQLINVLVHTCFEYDSILSANLADRIANDWLQQGVTTAAQAIDYVNKRRKHQRKNTRYTSNTKVVKHKKDWSAKKKEATHSKEQIMTDEEMNQIFKDFGKKN